MRGSFSQHVFRAYQYYIYMQTYLLLHIHIIYTHAFWTIYMGVSKKGGTQQLLVSLLKMTMLGCFGGTTILGNTHIKVHYIYIYTYTICVTCCALG